MRPLLLILTSHLLLLAALNLPAQPGWSEDTVRLDTPTGVIEGSLVVPFTPDSSGGIPVALIIAGSGPTDRDGNNGMMTNNSLKMLAYGLAERGIASLRYDKRGIGRSKSAGIEESALRLEHYMDDAAGWIHYLHNDGRFGAVTVTGHSLGGLVGMVAARQAEADKFISLCGTGRPGAETLRRQLQGQPPIFMEYALPVLDSLEQGHLVYHVDPGLNMLFRDDVQPYLLSWFKYDPREEIARLDIPVLVIQGSTDLQIPVEEAEGLAAASEDAELRIFEGMNHVLRTAPPETAKNLPTYNDPDLPLHDGLVDAIAGFVLR